MTRELPKDLKKGELILILPWKKCDFMVLAEFDEPSPESNDSFYARKADILYAQREDHILPHVNSDMEKANTSNPDAQTYLISYNTFKSRYEIKLFPFKDSRFWIGLENIIKSLEEAVPYHAHAASLEYLQEEEESNRLSEEDWLSRRH